jgi:hypothetical protein
MVVHDHIVPDDRMTPDLPAGTEILLIDACPSLKTPVGRWFNYSSTRGTVFKILQPREWWNWCAVYKAGIVAAAALGHQRSPPTPLVILKLTVYRAVAS